MRVRRAIAGTGTPMVVSERQRGELDRLGQVRVESRTMQLVPNGSFANRAEGWQPHDHPNSALDVNGARFWVGGPDELGPTSNALRVVRETSKKEHGETGLIQTLDRDVSGFRHLFLRAWVRVDYAELSGGGQMGFEYPMMLRLVYNGPAESSEYPWVVGFYYANPENRPVPPRTALMWPQGTWQQYEVDLKDTDEPNVPYRLRELTVMGQGHSTTPNRRHRARRRLASLVSEIAAGWRFGAQGWAVTSGGAWRTRERERPPSSNWSCRAAWSSSSVGARDWCAEGRRLARAPSRRR